MGYVSNSDTNGKRSLVWFSSSVCLFLFLLDKIAAIKTKQEIVPQMFIRTVASTSVFGCVGVWVCRDARNVRTPHSIPMNKESKGRRKNTPELSCVILVLYTYH